MTKKRNMTVSRKDYFRWAKEVLKTVSRNDTAFRAGTFAEAFYRKHQKRVPTLNDPRKTAARDTLAALREIGVVHTPRKGGLNQYVAPLTDAQYLDFVEAYKRKKKGETAANPETEGVTLLGDHATEYKYDDPTAKILETFPNQYPDREYQTEFVFTEFSSLCPKTGQPDFARITVRYIPNDLCIETKSLKLYFLSYRQHGSFMETITNRILEDLVDVCDPRWMEVYAEFNARGGTLINVQAEYP